MFIESILLLSSLFLSSLFLSSLLLDSFLILLAFLFLDSLPLFFHFYKTNSKKTDFSTKFLL